ncbi:acid protease [Penicillium macrosclerotiorum]|uniref:acid protease n=1 Tax=Penicillium macrosclerotiorum TaxID=303699 RepID=UPI002548F7DB|nr:acid protease [Penicillium macrosclerotiorum]KAJ5690419.1 acid protease [Penicillium macrosclerotiorum]
MFTSSMLLGALGIIPMCAAIPHYVPSRIDLDHRIVPNMKPKYGVETLSEENGFWFGSFDVGDSKNLTLLIDTGSSDVIVNPGLYKKGPKGVDIDQTFTNSYGTTESDGSGTGTKISGTLYNDTMRFGSLRVHQTVGSATSSANGEVLIPGDGIVGFAGLEVSFLTEHPLSFILFVNKVSLMLADLESSCDLSTTAIIQEWALYADIVLDGVTIKNDALVELDTGTATVIGPVDDVIAIFKASSMEYAVQTSEDSGTTVTGYFPCDKPPTLGLSIPSQKNATAAMKEKSRLVSHRSSTFNIAADQWIAADNGNNNCTAILSGTDAFPIPDLWVVGQPFFHGTYIDHNLKTRTLGFAPAKC